jgi:hypothetical protein
MTLGQTTPESTESAGSIENRPKGAASTTEMW